MRLLSHPYMVSVVGLFMMLCAKSTAAQAMNLEMGTTITCSSNAECKRKCEAIGGRWRKDTSGSTYGTCTLPRKALPELIKFSRDAMKKEKQVAHWTHPGDEEKSKAISIKPSECDALGGDVEYYANCRRTRLKCTESDTTGNRRSVCISDVDQVLK